MIIFFFFSSRRRHTRCGRDWSSDVCSSDLQVTTVLRKPLLERRLQLQPGQEEVIVSTLTGPLKGTVQAEIGIEDDFPLDNPAYAAAPTPTQTSVLLLGETNDFL